jgi:putative Mg2+ transporter-C (MgtC) family protein
MVRLQCVDLRRWNGYNGFTITPAERGGYMSIENEDLLRIVLALLAGGLIGIEREFRDKAAGFRTMIFICAGSALYTIVSLRVGASTSPDRIASGIVTGVGFIGAGVILRESGRILGLTTAASIWLTAAIGITVGAGYYTLAAGVEIVALVVLWVFPIIDGVIDSKRDDRTYEITCRYDMATVKRLEQRVSAHGLRMSDEHLGRDGDRAYIRWDVGGRPAGHEALVAELFADPEVQSVRY